ncbi:MAG: response regulator [Dissulfurispiraceae bacterium]
MFRVKEKQSFDQSINFFDMQLEKNVIGNIRSILIVDEDRDVLNQLSQSFAICAKQYNICTVRNSMDALKALKTTSVKILLTALNMPMMHDFDLLDYTRKYYPATRIFAMSEEEPSAIKKRLDDLGIYGYIKKPFRIEMIYSILRV